MVSTQEKLKKVIAKKITRKTVWKRGMVVYDVSWPWELGSIHKVLKTVLYVRWHDSRLDNTKYDKAHQQFLRRLES